ncbi:MAG TPA: hypothetical protein VK509_07870, partial [Polyangiales bacterium]|nr:hypothetical protein [Polyangiales bacterium]
MLVTKLGVDSVLYEGDVDATNWMSALRAAREGMAERPSVPPGVSCSIDGQGVATVLDPGSRRRFVLAPNRTPQPNAGGAPPPAQASAPRPEPVIPPNPLPVINSGQDHAHQGHGKRFETVAFVPEHMVERPVPVAGSPSSGPPPAQPAPVATAVAAAVAAPAVAAAVAAPAVAAAVAAPAEQPVAAQAPVPAPAVDPAPSRKKKKFETVAFAPVMDGPAGALDPTPRDQPAVAPDVRVADSGPAAAHSSSMPPGRRANAELELLFERNEEPTEGNPLLYCERAYLLPRGTTVTDAEAALRWKLADMQRELESRRRGKLVNLAVFDHRWTDAPERPPVITLQWRDWRSEVVVDYPAAARHSSAPPSSPGGGHDDRLADVFEALGALGRLSSAADALDFAVKLLERTVPCEAVAASLYDINTDELR